MLFNCGPEPLRSRVWPADGWPRQPVGKYTRELTLVHARFVKIFGLFRRIYVRVTDGYF